MSFFVVEIKRDDDTFTYYFTNNVGEIYIVVFVSVSIREWEYIKFKKRSYMNIQRNWKINIRKRIYTNTISFTFYIGGDW